MNLAGGHNSARNNFFLPFELHHKKPFFCYPTGYGPSPEVSEMGERILFCHINEKAQKKNFPLFLIDASKTSLFIILHVMIYAT